MARPWRILWTVGALASLVVAASCSTTDRDGQGRAAPDAVDPDAIVWQETSSLGRLASAAGDLPGVTIYGDGRIYVIDIVRDELRTRVGSVPQDELRGFLAQVADSITTSTSTGARATRSGRSRRSPWFLERRAADPPSQGDR